MFSAPSHATGPDVKDKQFIKELFGRRGFAVTHLNNYLKCPWQYFFVNLLRIPKASESPQMYGTAIHAALRDLFTHEERNKNYLVSQFESYLSHQPMPA